MKTDCLVGAESCQVLALKHNWQKLTDEEIAFYQESPDIFYDVVKQKYGMFKNDVERRMKQLKVRRYFFNW